MGFVCCIQLSFDDLQGRSHDESGILKSRDYFSSLITDEINNGVPESRIVLGNPPPNQTLPTLSKIPLTLLIPPIQAVSLKAAPCPSLQASQGPINSLASSVSQATSSCTTLSKTSSPKQPLHLINLFPSSWVMGMRIRW